MENRNNDTSGLFFLSVQLSIQIHDVADPGKVVYRLCFIRTVHLGCVLCELLFQLRKVVCTSRSLNHCNPLAGGDRMTHVKFRKGVVVNGHTRIVEGARHLVNVHTRWPAPSPNEVLQTQAGDCD